MVSCRLNPEARRRAERMAETLWKKRGDIARDYLVMGRIFCTEEEFDVITV